MDTPLDLPNIRIITVSGRIASGSTTLAKHLAKTLHWKHMEGGEIFWEAVRARLTLAPKDTGLRPDEEDEAFEEYQKKVLQEENHIILESKLAGFCAQGIEGVFKILALCEDQNGIDQTSIRIDRMVNREKMTIDEAKEEVVVREKSDIEKWQRLYAKNDKNWVYWDKKYYDLVINSFSQDQQQALNSSLDAMGYNK